jgi:hypothetical protein
VIRFASSVVVPGRSPTVDLGLANPGSQGFGVDAELIGDALDRTCSRSRIAAFLDRQPRRSLFSSSGTFSVLPSISSFQCDEILIAPGAQQRPVVASGGVLEGERE